MQVKKITNTNSTSFGQKRCLDKKTYGYLKELLPKMNKQAVYVSNDTNYKSSFLKELQVDDFTLIDGRALLKQVSQEEQMQKETLIEYGKTQLVISNKDGEIIDANTSIFTSWKNLLSKVADYIKLITENFDNTKLVKKTRLNSSGLTEEGRIKQNKLNDKFAKLESEILNN